jgi:hypothetical protein
VGKWVECKIEDRRQVIRERRKEGGKEKWARKHKKLNGERARRTIKKSAKWKFR